MSMTVNDIAAIVERLAPLEEAYEKDNVGLLVGDGSRQVRKIMTALDATLDVVKAAAALDVDMIVTHHPVIFSPVDRINGETPIGQKLIMLIENRISVCSAHTNLDKAPDGLNELLGRRIGLKEITVNPSQEASGFVKIGKLERPTALKDFAEQIKASLGLDYIHYAGEPGKQVALVAFCSGSGMSLIDEARATGADVYVTGDLKYHDAVDAVEAGFAIIDATHFGTEKPAVKMLADHIREYADDSVEVVEDRRQPNPILLG